MKNFFAMSWVLIDYMVLRPVLAPARLKKQTNRPLQCIRDYFLPIDVLSMDSLPPAQEDFGAEFTIQTVGKEELDPGASEQSQLLLFS